MKRTDIITSFNNLAYSNPFEINTINLLRLKKIASYVGSGKRVLDIGCYDGSIAKFIKKNGNTVIGVDIAQTAVKMAKKNGIEAYVCDVEENNFPKQIGDFDVVVAAEIIEHIFDPDAFLEKVKKILKRKGSLILTTPNLAGIGSRISLMLGRLPWMIENDLLPGKSGHIRYFTLAELEKLLNRRGFSVSSFTTDSFGVENITVPFLDKLFPTLGRILIVKAEKE